MIPAPDSPAYRHIAASLAEAVKRLHSRLAPLSDDDGTQEPCRRLADPIRKTHREPDPLTRRTAPATNKTIEAA